MFDFGSDFLSFLTVFLFFIAVCISTCKVASDKCPNKFDKKSSVCRNCHYSCKCSDECSEERKKL